MSGCPPRPATAEEVARAFAEVEARLIADLGTSRSWLDAQATKAKVAPYGPGHVPYTRVLDTGDTMVRYFTGAQRPCPIPGCGRIQLETLWPSGRRTWMCTDGLTSAGTLDSGDWRAP